MCGWGSESCISTRREPPRSLASAAARSGNRLLDLVDWLRETGLLPRHEPWTERRKSADTSARTAKIRVFGRRAFWRFGKAICVKVLTFPEFGGSHAWKAILSTWIESRFEPDFGFGDACRFLILFLARPLPC